MYNLEQDNSNTYYQSHSENFQASIESQTQRNDNSRSRDFECQKICCEHCNEVIQNGQIVKIINNQIYCHIDCLILFDKIINEIKEISPNYVRTDHIVNNTKKIEEFPFTLKLKNYVLKIKK